jgi:hypothetical protein
MDKYLSELQKTRYLSRVHILKQLVLLLLHNQLIVPTSFFWQFEFRWWSTYDGRDNRGIYTRQVISIHEMTYRAAFPL